MYRANRGIGVSWKRILERPVANEIIKRNTWKINWDVRLVATVSKERKVAEKYVDDRNFLSLAVL